MIKTHITALSDIGMITSSKKISSNKLIVNSDFNSQIHNITLQSPHTKRIILDKDNVM